MSGALGALALIAGGRDHLAGELCGGAHVDEPGGRADRLKDLVAACADRLVAGLRGEARRPVGGKLGVGRKAVGDPLFARPIEQQYLLVAVVLQVPVCVGGEPVVAVAVEDDRVLVGDAAAAEQLAERLGGQEVAADGVLEVGLPVEADRAGDVGLGVEGGVLVDLDDPESESSSGAPRPSRCRPVRPSHSQPWESPSVGVVGELLGSPAR